MVWVVITVVSALVGIGGAQTAASLSQAPISISQIRISPCHKVVTDSGSDADLAMADYKCDESKAVISNASFQSPAKS